MQTFDMSLGYNYCYASEFIFYFRKGKKKLNKLGLCNVLRHHTSNNGKNKLQHPTQKPLSLIKELIRNSSNENDMVFDPFMGSGTAAVAAQSLNRKFLGFEREQAYFDICMQRLNQTKLEVFTQ